MAGRKKKPAPGGAPRRPPGGHPIQAQSPTASWMGPGLCPPPPELSTPAARRGEVAARRERLRTIIDLDDIITNNLDQDDPEATRALRRWALEEYLAQEERDPSPPYTLPSPAAARPAFDWPDP